MSTSGTNLSSSSAPKTHYEMLEIPSSASQKQIRSAYLKLAKIHHPDINSANSQYFESISIAYKVLSNDVERQKYDARVLRDLITETHLLSDLEFREEDVLEVQVVCRCGNERWVALGEGQGDFVVECERCSSRIRIENDLGE